MIGKTLSHYKILEKLGEGGMGIVYRAIDTKLDRPVALKFLPVQLAEDETALKRLFGEAISASRINHPNVCIIHDIKEHNGQQFIVMEYVDGRTLREIIKEAPLEINLAVEYAIHMCEALNAAHNKDIIHRDVKSDNIMVTADNQVKVMDFGLAKLKGSVRLTKTFSAVGTMAYMAPEQIRGEEVDKRIDIFSFGIVMYEMLTGRFPFRGEYEAAMMYSIQNEAPQLLLNYRDDIPDFIERIILKTLEKDPVKRYQNMQEIIQELKKVPALKTAEPEQEKSIVVLPFENMSSDPEQEYFSDGLTEEVITDLSHIHDLRVISRTSAMMLKGTKKDMKTIGRELNVRYVLEGSIRKAGNNLRIVAQLIDASSDAHLWAEKYNGTLDDVFDIQEKVSRSIVDALKVKLSPEENIKIADRPIYNVLAFDYYHLAKRLIHRGSEEDLNQAINNLQLGLDIIGNDTLLNKGMAEAYLYFYEFGYKADEETLLNVEKYANKIIELQPDSDKSNYLLGRIERFRGSASKAAKYFKKAYEINPANTDVLLFLGNAYGIHIGKSLLAEKMFKRLFDVDPISPLNYGVSAIFQTVAGQLDEALSSFKKMSELAHNDLWENLFSVYIYAMQKQYEKSHEMVEKIVAQKHKSKIHENFAEWCLFFKYSLQGEKSKALETISKEVKIYFWNDPEVQWFGICNYALINEKEEALNWLEHVINRGFINYPFLNDRIPFLENIRGEERFRKLMVRVKHEWENFEV